MSEHMDARGVLRTWLGTGVVPRPSNDETARWVVESAGAQGLSGLLDGAIAADAAFWPESERSRLRAASREAFLRGVRQLDLAGRVQGLLLTRGIRALPLKGAAVAETVYDSVAERPMGDVDLLVLDNWSGAVGALREAGFEERERADHAWSFAHPDAPCLLELHHSVTSSPGLFPFDADALWSRSLPGPGQVQRLPSTEDLLVHLSLHAAFQHGLVLTLVQYLDFRRLFERASLDPARLLELAIASRAEVAVAAALQVADVVVGGCHGKGVLDRFGPRLPVGFRRWLSHQVHSPLERVVPVAPSLLRVRWQVSAGRRFEFLRRTVASQAPGEEVSALRRGYAAVLRAVKLLCRHGIPALKAGLGMGRSPADGKHATMFSE